MLCVFSLTHSPSTHFLCHSCVFICFVASHSLRTLSLLCLCGEPQHFCANWLVSTPLQGPVYCPLLLCLFVSLRIWWFSSQSFFLFPPQFGFPMSLPSLDYLSCKISPSQKANYKHPLFVFLFFFFFSFLFILFWVMEACCCNLEVDVNGEETFMVDKVTLSLFVSLLYCLVQSACFW